MITLNVKIKRNYARLCLTTNVLSEHEVDEIFNQLKTLEPDTETQVSLLLNQKLNFDEQCSKRVFKITEPLSNADIEIVIDYLGITISKNK
ncbi:hypothetical protein HJ167_20980 [Vibrio parahaemolyticus]|uniref:hypothetical protein n=1 Tax=Vibrio TaxID=662 RepID=UPI002808EB0D|nr:hypothetical protein [Vibrio sp. Vb0587]EGR5855716.1 hypothetical protein [Vibrio parahaemolyticus]ELA8201066.1 hypothetical protein [Vibrio parahaemolyticus]MBE4780075.1 hypothetical protein [Vibrio parahaemolyticus]MDG3410532.1 hypothetical protein [Vibrio parahaemolyticus]MDW1965677.1 hypothetical protein [Vibrio sp. Vb0587]